MQPFIIEPAQGIVGLSLSSRQSDVRDFFGSGWERFQRTADSDECDYWPAIAVFAHYDGEDTLEALEFGTPAKVLLDGNNILGVDPLGAEQVLRSGDPNAVSDADGVRSRSLGVSLWADGFRDGTPVQAVLVSRDGY
jgi:hypothetical protein